MNEQIPVSHDAIIDPDGSRAQEIARGLAYQRLLIVNVAFVGPAGAGDRGWTLVDAGLAGSAGAIERAAAERFGSSSRPAAIVLTHGHFDHVGALETLAERWDVPVYAHAAEAPYLTGRASYPPPDPSVGGGAMAALSRFFPRGPIDVSNRLQLLPADGAVPTMPGWRWIPTPGHSAGHVSFWREAGRALIAGDAFVTTRQESAYAAAVQKAEMHGPPAYFTTDWEKAERSVTTLAELEPEVAITGHGRPMKGPEMRAALRKLAAEFRAVAVPERGRYVDAPASAQGGEYR